ncbi:unnamed protein product [Trichobilharzia regenti]|nr:unnamed protein product [Trichobilharzia regenti]
MWDIGIPSILRTVLPLRRSEFRKNITLGKYPFQQDHSGSMTPIKLAWKTEIQNVDFGLLFPELIEGLTDIEPSIVRIAKAAIIDLLKHGPLDKLIDTLPVLTEAIRSALVMNNVEVARRVLIVLRHICTIQPGIGPDISYYLRDIFQHLNYYFEAHKNYNDQIVYNPSLSDDLYDLIDDVVKRLLQISGNELETAEDNIKLALPTYQINRLTI